ncbi:MAG: lysostaphin resistance A-like protein [Anaerolineae bacterium]
MRTQDREGTFTATGSAARPALLLVLEGLLFVEGLNAFAFMKHDFPRFWPVGVVLTLVSLAWIGWMSRRIFGYRLADLGLTRGQVGWCVWALVGAAFLLGLAIELRWPSPVRGEVTVIRLLTATSFSVVYSPLYEELLFRGYLFRRAWSVWPGALGSGWYRVHFASLFSAGLWALNHLPSLALLVTLGFAGESPFAADWGFVIQVALIGVLAGELRARTGSIWPGVVLHALMNGLFVVSLVRAFALGMS